MAKKPRPDKYKEGFTVLVVENDQARSNWLQRNKPDNVKIHDVSSGQIALGVITRMRPADYGGIMLDCDLDPGLGRGPEDYYSGVDIAQLIVQHASNDVPILVHSHNSAGAARMLMVLQSNGFEVVRIPFRELTRERLREWLLEIEESLGIDWI